MADRDVPLSFTDFDRVFADLPPAVLKNRIFEQNPAVAKQSAFIARPGTTDLGTYGNGRIRRCWSLPGLFGGSLFFVSGDTLYRREVDGNTFPITGTIYNDGDVSMCGVKGLDYERLFIADGSVLQIYSGGSQASATATLSANVSPNDWVRLGDTYYQWVTPDTALTVPNGAGTLANPWKMPIGADTEASIRNLQAAVAFDGTPGVDFSANMGGQNTVLFVTVIEDTVVTQFTVTAYDDTDDGNELRVDESSTVITYSDTTTNTAGEQFMSGGGNHGLNGVEVPDGLPPLKVGTLKSHVLVAIGRSDRFYWVEPGAVVIDPLNFATAESQPDDTVALEIIGDNAWFIGESSTEIWYATGNAEVPFAPVNGRVYDRGAVAGTVVNVKGVVHLVGQDGIVYAIAGQPQRISNHGIEEVIRKQLETE